MKAFLEQLKQRKVIRAAGLYAVSGYAVFQVANNLLPALGAPPWTVTLIAVLFVLGFPLVTVLSYAFDWTPDGPRRTEPDAAAAAPSKLGWFDWTVLAASAAVLLFAVVGLSIGVRGASDAAPGQTAITPAKSIAVLPFVNFSGPGDADYFADGLTEELINGLAQLPDLKVAARTSSFYYKGRNEDLREIGRRLGVANVLEGSVRSFGDKLRITVQLIQVSDGFHLISQTFDSDSGDAFAIQQAIARSVSGTLKARLLDPAGADGARDPRAYQLELVARSHLRRDELRELEAARDLYRELLSLEPGNADAHAGFAEATISLAQNHLALDFDQALRESEAAIETALTLAPDSSEVWRVRGLIHRIVAIRSGLQPSAEMAEDAFRRAADLDPSNADALAMLAIQLLGDDRREQAIALLRRALEIDPLSRRTQQLLGTALASQGKFAEARRQYESLIDLFPDYTYAPIALGDMLIAQGKLDEAVRILDDPELIATDPEAALMLAHCYANLGMRRELETTLEGVREPPPAAAVARAARLLLDRDWTALRELAAVEHAKTNDPIWLSARLLDAVLTQDARNAAAALEVLGLDTVGALTELARSSALDSILTAQALRLAGRTTEGEQIEQTLLRRLDFSPGEYVSNDALRYRVLANAALGQRDAAIDDLARATEQGFRTLVDFDYFVRLDDYPFMRDVAADPRYRELAQRIETDNLRMREALLADPP